MLSNYGHVDKDGNVPSVDTNFKIKSRVIARDINVTLESGRVVKKTVYEKQVVFWSKKYGSKARGIGKKF